MLEAIDPTVTDPVEARTAWHGVVDQANGNTPNVEVDVDVRCPNVTTGTDFNSYPTSESVPSYLNALNGCAMPAVRSGGTYAFTCDAEPSNTNRRRLCYCSPPPSPPAPPPSPPLEFHTYFGAATYFPELTYKEDEQHIVQYKPRREAGLVEAGDLVLYVPIAECAASGNAWLARFAIDYPYDAYVTCSPRRALAGCTRRFTSPRRAGTAPSTRGST
jgi:hypothetical protein